MLLYSSIAVILLVIVGAFSFLKLIRKKKTNVAESTVEVIDTTKSSVNLLERNNAMLSEWSQTNQTRDKLKILEMSAKLEES